MPKTSTGALAIPDIKAIEVIRQQNLSE